MYQALEVVVCGTFRRERERLQADWVELLCAGAEIISPRSIEFVAGEEEGFVRAAHELDAPAGEIEKSHLEAITRCALIWLHLPHGHLGASASAELGFAHALGVPAYARALPGEPGLDWMIRKVDSPAAAIADFHRAGEALSPFGLQRLQHYYQRAATRRGWSGEGVEETIERLRGEIKEFETAKSRQERRLEQADIQLYATHLANVADIDSGAAVVDKERLNAHRFG